MTTLRTLALAALLALVLVPSAAAADTHLLLVHGYGDAAEGKDCNGSTWRNALRYYQDAGGRSRSSMSTVTYYEGSSDCDVQIGRSGNDKPIQDISRDLAQYIYTAYTRHGKPVDVIAHSMGGLVTRVALLGSAQGWKGFPPKLDVNNVVTLSTPHQGLAHASDGDEQLRQMSRGSGFLKRLHEHGSGLGDSWASGTDWTLIGSQEDSTVSYASGIDKGHHADQKFGYQSNAHDSGAVTHSGVRTLFGKNRYDLNYSHVTTQHTLHGWAPLKAAFQAATHIGDNLPK